MGGRVTPVSLALKAEGVAEVKQALRGVKQSFVEMERESLAATKQASKERVALLKEESKAKIALIRDESKARREVMNAERAFKHALGRREGSLGGGGAGAALARGEGLEGILKAAGVAGLAVAAFSGAINLASSCLKQFASFVVNDVIKPSMALETRAQQVANNSNGKLQAGEVQGKARAIGLRNNMDPMALIEAAGIFQDLTGEPKVGFDVMNTVATISKARGFDTKDLASFAGALYKPGMKADELSRLLLMQTAQGTSGSVTIGQLARLGGKVTAPAASLAGNYETRLAMTGALLQSGRRGFGTVEEAATGLQTFMTDAMIHGKQLSPKSFLRDAGGVEKLADPAAFIADVYRKTQGNASRLHAMQFSEPTTKLIGAYKEQYGEAFDTAKASGKSDAQAREEAAKAVETFIKSFATATTTMEAEESKRNAVMETSGEKLEQAINRIKDRITDAMPEIEELVNALVDKAPDIADAALTLTEALIDLANWIKNIAPTVQQSLAPRNAKEFFLGGLLSPFSFDNDAPESGDAGPTVEARDTINAARRARHRKPIDADHTSERGAWKRVGPSGELTFYPEEKGGYSEAPPPAASSSSSEEMSSASAEATQSAAEAHSELADNSSEASDALCKLTSCVNDLVSSVQSLNRSQPFTNR
jgi:hypothetical protein